MTHAMLFQRARRILCSVVFGIWGCAPTPPRAPLPQPRISLPVLSQGGANLLGKAKQPGWKKNLAGGLEVKPRLMID